MSGPELVLVLRYRKAVTMQTLDAGWDMAAIGEGESTPLSLVDAKGDPTTFIHRYPCQTAPIG
ncbi:hypothetical protein Aca07nite_41970 [Actinoplanes capillaceus]|uniref:Uncharacterized protein n=1 Tax=Actinoplanes campanulatus TaxID=113559 RepID=A0ABQ3WL15_9ACTN|nr:hypothetical protein [Actinoplanes capillaceus]GID46922.1 hypothetical protein Aca07nite_41970 [Actinoplanes capillaceus]